MVHFFTLRLLAPRHIPPAQVLPEELGRFLMARQVHGDAVFVADRPVSSWPEYAEAVSGTPSDALITNQPGIGVAVVTADCVPILLHDPVRGVVGAVHAGWRGTVRNILAGTVARMVESFSCRPEEIHAAIGPAIGPCCYEVGEEVSRGLEESVPGWESCFHPEGRGKGRLDLSALNRIQLREAGIPEAHIQTVDLCTACHPDLFFSYRRDGIGTGRMVSGILRMSEGEAKRGTGLASPSAGRGGIGGRPEGTPHGPPNPERADG